MTEVKKAVAKEVKAKWYKVIHRKPNMETQPIRVELNGMKSKTLKDGKPQILTDGEVNVLKDAVETIHEINANGVMIPVKKDVYIIVEVNKEELSEANKLKDKLVS